MGSRPSSRKRCRATRLVEGVADGLGGGRLVEDAPGLRLAPRDEAVDDGPGLGPPQGGDLRQRSRALRNRKRELPTTNKRRVPQLSMIPAWTKHTSEQSREFVILCSVAVTATDDRLLIATANCRTSFDPWPRSTADSTSPFWSQDATPGVVTNGDDAFKGQLAAKVEPFTKTLTV
jgi:hypothetical protein